MKTKLIISVSTFFLLTSIHAQTAEQITAENYIQNAFIPTTNNIKTSKEPNYYIFNDKKYTELAGQVVWVGETAVMNSSDGSFQVWFKKVPTSNKNYPIKPYGTYAANGTENDASVVLLTDSYSSQFWSISPNTGTIKVIVNNNGITITVKNVKLCIDNSKDCKNISGNILLKK